MSLVITGIVDGPLTGGVPKAIELFALSDVADLSIYEVESANNDNDASGGGYQLSGSILAGEYLYLSAEAEGFASYFGFDPTYPNVGEASVNGDDAIVLYEAGSIVDVFGTVGPNEADPVWSYADGWAVRNDGTGPSTVFDPADWTFSGDDALDGATTNATAAAPMPIGGYVRGDDAGETPGDEPGSFVISEIDADTPGTDMAEFVEIFDGGAGGTSLDGLTLVLFNGNGDTAYDAISLDGQVTNAGGYFVVGSEAVANVGLAAFTSDGLQNGADAVALYAGAAPAVGEAATQENLLDAVVYDTNDADDAEMLAALGQSVQWNEDANGEKDTQSLSRVGDGFVAGTPTPGTGASETGGDVLPETVTLVSEVQGSTFGGADYTIGADDISPLDGQLVTIEAVITADYQSNGLGSMRDLGGFFVQEERADWDADATTSEGVFVFEGFEPVEDFAVGDLVRITGTVGEFRSQTQIEALSAEVLASGQELPDAIDVTLEAGDAVADGSGGYVANLEAYEGMRITLAQNVTVSELFNLDRFGEYTVAAGGRPVQFTQDNLPDEAGYEAHLRDVASRSVFIDDGRSVQNPDELRIIDGNDGVLQSSDEFRMGDTLTGVTGVLGYGFDEFRIQTPVGEWENTNPRPETAPEVDGAFRVASLNVLNYFTTIDAPGVSTDNGSDPRGADTQAELDRQTDKLVTAILGMEADVLGLIEIENDFAGDAFAVKTLVEELNAQSDGEDWAFVDPGQEFVGGDAIANAIIYRADKVTPLGDMAILTEFEGRDFIDPLDAGRPLNRPAIAQSFEDIATQKSFTVSVNHLKSKGSLSGLDADEAQGDGQGNNNATREAAAEILSDWLASDPTGQGASGTMILGDLNSYAQEDPIRALEDAGYTDVASALLGEDAYSYVFDGQIGTLDYVLVDDGLLGEVAGIAEWHINADEADALDYNLDFGRDPQLFDGTSPARHSDHDPVLAGFDFDIAYDVIAGTGRRDVLTGTDRLERLEGGAGNDILSGQGGADLLLGGAGNDAIYGGAGDDILVAGPGRLDTLFGGSGADTFAFSEEIATDGARDRSIIWDFDAVEDRIDLGGAEIDAIRGAGPIKQIDLEGGGDTITVMGVWDADEIQFVEPDLSM
ncbi:putative extracellular nuclease [Palleronia aestuarii]|uniref:Putative extracellular nuclease n=1 Tax=Palleronia aestuarii TaxID=568105 RepID=A0A2W7NX55_9RHOB|nr:ExeM/NucH family extracellular endonuclease [Palleronia aestuarii]PZX15822.1 putative extracellular nuclease [Palleronia aestuarii]